MADVSNVRLRQGRRRRAWKLHDVVHGLDEMAVWLVEREPERAAWLGIVPTSPRRRCRRDLGVDVNMVARWERGARRPSPRYALLLCLLFDEEPELLGLEPGVWLASEYRRLAVARRHECSVGSGRGIDKGLSSREFAQCAVGRGSGAADPGWTWLDALLTPSGTRPRSACQRAEKT